MRLLSSRLPYSAIVDRPPLKLPQGGRLIVWNIVNVEEWSIERAMPRTVLSPPLGQPLLPDLPNWAWHEYGMRVGFWRLLEALQKFNVTPTLAINGSVCRSYPRVAQAAHEAGWEFMGHGYVQRPMHHVEDQKKAIADTMAAIKECTGKAPRGWESPGLTETPETIDLLAEAGIEYVADWVPDDQPCRIETASGSLVSPNFMDFVVVFGFVAAVLRGLDSFVGAVVGGLVLGLTTTYVAGYVDQSLVTLSALTILLAVLLLKPAGLFSSSVARRV